MCSIHAHLRHMHAAPTQSRVHGAQHGGMCRRRLPHSAATLPRLILSHHMPPMQPLAMSACLARTSWHSPVCWCRRASSKCRLSARSFMRHPCPSYFQPRSSHMWALSKTLRPVTSMCWPSHKPASCIGCACHSRVSYVDNHYHTLGRMSTRSCT